MITLTLSRDVLRPSLRRLADEDLIHRSVLAAGTVLMSLAQRAFDEPGLRPSPWKPRKSGGAHPLLLKSGTLRQSIHVRDLGGGKVLVGTPARYAAHQQFGSAKTSGRGSGVPARPFFPVSKTGQLTPAAKAAMGEAITAVIDAAK